MSNLHQPGAAATDRRVVIRYSCEVDGKCVPLLAASREQWTATLANISRGGTLLTVDRRFERGTVLEIEISLAEADIVRLPVSVAHVRRCADGRYAVGCRFARPMPDGVLQSLVDVADG